MNETIRLLLADDQEMVRAGFRMVLDAQQEMTVVGEVGDGRDAVDAVLGAEADQRPDLVLMDIRMPLMDGLTAANNIRHLSNADAHTVPIIAMTANAFDDDIEKSKAAGMNAHLAKPVDPQRLYQLLYDFVFGKED